MKRYLKLGIPIILSGCIGLEPHSAINEENYGIVGISEETKDCYHNDFSSVHDLTSMIALYGLWHIDNKVLTESSKSGLILAQRTNYEYFDAEIRMRANLSPLEGSVAGFVFGYKSPNEGYSLDVTRSGTTLRRSDDWDKFSIREPDHPEKWNVYSISTDNGTMQFSVNGSRSFTFRENTGLGGIGFRNRDGEIEVDYVKICPTKGD